MGVRHRIEWNRAPYPSVPMSHGSWALTLSKAVIISRRSAPDWALNTLSLGDYRTTLLPTVITTINGSKGGRNIFFCGGQSACAPDSSSGEPSGTGERKGQWKLGDKRGLFWKVNTFKIHFYSA